MDYSFKSIAGTFTVNEKGDLVKGTSKKEAPKDLVPKVLTNLKDQKYHEKFFIENLKITKKDIKAAVGEDTLIIQSIRVIDDLNHVINILGKRVREWYEYYNPEYTHRCLSHEKLVDMILTKSRKELLAEVKIIEKETMGSDLDEDDLDAIRVTAERVKSLVKLKDIEKDYIESKMKNICPNMLTLTGALIGANLLEHAGTLKRLSEMPASTIQLLGAEKALFKHLTTGAKCPKYGLLFNHPYVQGAKIKGKAARLLADKISIAVKVDYFKGEFIGDKLNEMLEKKLVKVR